MQSGFSKGVPRLRREPDPGQRLLGRTPRIRGAWIPSEPPWITAGAISLAAARQSTADAVKRAGEVAAWLRSPALHEELGPSGEVVLVSHADFLALLLAALHGDAASPLHSDTSPDLDVSYHGVSELQLQSTLDEHQQADYARCVYSKYKLSLASCTLLEIADSGAVHVVSMNDRSYLASSKRCCVQ